MRLKDGTNVVIIKKDMKDRGSPYWFDTDGHFEEDKDMGKLIDRAKELSYTHYRLAGGFSISRI